MIGSDTWLDLWRIGNFLVGATCLVWLIGGLVKQKGHWNTKTRDLWYSRMVWTIVEMSASIEGLIKGRPLSYTLLLLTIAGLVTLKALLKKGEWGYVE